MVYVSESICPYYTNQALIPLQGKRPIAEDLYLNREKISYFAAVAKLPIEMESRFQLLI